LIELWETFLLQLDAEDDGQDAFYKPPASAAVQSTDDRPTSNEAETVSEVATATDVALEQDT